MVRRCVGLGLLLAAILGPFTSKAEPFRAADRELFVLHLSLVAGVPSDLGGLVFDAADRYGLDRYDLAAVLICEHAHEEHDFRLLARLRLDDRALSFDPLAEGDEGERGSASFCFRALIRVSSSWVLCLKICHENFGTYTVLLSCRIGSDAESTRCLSGE